MGYWTHHELKVDEGDIGYHAEQIVKLTPYADIFDGEAVKWYDHEEHMRTYSKLHPETLFTLKGEGEEIEDVWIEYHKNGRMQRVEAQIVFEEFDEALME